MRLHDRYLFRELMTPLAICLGGFVILGVSLFFTKDLDKIHEHHLTLVETAEYCATSLPELFVLVLPILMLLALLWALTHHARHNEITALRAAGVSLWRLCVPYFVAGLLTTGLYFATNEYAVPASDRWGQQLLERHADASNKSRPAAGRGGNFSNPREHRNWLFSDYDPRTTRMLNPTVTWTLPDGSWHELDAASAIRSNGVWTFFDVQPRVKYQAAQSEPVRLGFTNVLAVPEFNETPDQVRLLLKFANSQTLHGSGSADIPLAELWDLMRNKPGLTRQDVNAIETKFHGRLATPWECFVVVLVAVPFGAPAGRRNLFYGVAGSIFIGFTYFILQKFSLALGMNGLLPGWLAAWLPNLVFAALGIVLTLRVR
jgi:lipopolysaccharide export system permease protein